MCHIILTTIKHQQHPFVFDIGGTRIECDLHEVRQLAEYCRQILSQNPVNPYYEDDD